MSENPSPMHCSVCRTSFAKLVFLSPSYTNPSVLKTNTGTRIRFCGNGFYYMDYPFSQISDLNQFEPTVFLTKCLIQKSVHFFFEYLNRRNVYVILSDLNDLIFWHFLAFVSKIEEWAEWDCLNFWMFDCLWMTLRKILNFKNQIRVRAKERRQGGYLVLICSNLKHLEIW